MTAVALTATQISPADTTPDIVSVILTASVTAGQAAYQLTTGKFGIADANDSGKQQFRGIFLQAGAAGQVVPLLRRGLCYGFTVSGLNADDPLYLSDTAGALDTAAGTMTVVCGRVTAMTDTGTLTKVVFINAEWTRIWA
jgi:hypothetical protein